MQRVALPLEGQGYGVLAFLVVEAGEGGFDLDRKSVV